MHFHKTVSVRQDSDHILITKFWSFCSPRIGSVVAYHILFRLTTATVQCLLFYIILLHSLFSLRLIDCMMYDGRYINKVDCLSLLSAFFMTSYIERCAPIIYNNVIFTVNDKLVIRAKAYHLTISCKINTGLQLIILYKFHFHNTYFRYITTSTHIQKFLRFVR